MGPDPRPTGRAATATEPDCEAVEMNNDVKPSGQPRQSHHGTVREALWSLGGALDTTAPQDLPQRTSRLAPPPTLGLKAAGPTAVKRWRRTRSQPAGSEVCTQAVRNLFALRT
jgi:hypothetical protein